MRAHPSVVAGTLAALVTLGLTAGTLPVTHTAAPETPAAAEIRASDHLEHLVVAPGALKPAFNATRAGPYVVPLAFGTSALKITATASRSGTPKIEVKVAGGVAKSVTNGVPSSVALGRFGNTTIQVVVGGSMVYTLVAMKPPEPDATLKSFSITPGTLQPAFKPSIANYSILEGAEVATVEIMAVANDSAAQVKINGREKDKETGKWPPIPIAAGRNTTAVVSVLTNHGQASANKLYFVNITRPWNPLSDSSLKMLAVDADQPPANRAKLRPVFNPLINLYQVDEVPNASIVTVTLSANQSKATVSIGNNNLPKTGAIWHPAEITIPKRATDVKVRVTSPDGKTSSMYTLRLGSAGPGAANPADADYWQRLWGCGKVSLARKGDGGPCGLFWLALVAGCVLVLMSSGFVWARRRTRRFSDADVARYAHAVPDFRD